jgi:2-polyprenyl-3-methyl-5-hydroxy-6-metoxy-1,4-benzoquinol methylase
MNKDLITYYRKRAKEYDKVYLNPLEQDDLAASSSMFQKLVAQKTVLEIACGTGYWTEQLANTAQSVHATDVNEVLIEIAKERQISGDVTFEVADMYNLTDHQKYDVLFGGFIWSHLLLQDLDLLLDQWKSRLKTDGILIFIDSNCVKGTHHDEKKITTSDGFGNTYQTRQLEDGSVHLILKNFPTKDFLTQKLSRISTKINYEQLEYYWIVYCNV